MSYEYTDFDGDRLIIENTDWPANTASVSVHGNAVFVPAAEAPKAAQALLDAAGVKGAVVIDANLSNTVTVKIDASDIVKQIVFFKDLPEVSIDPRGRYRTESNIRWTQIDSDNPYCDINEHIRGLLAIKLRMEADAEKVKDDLRTLAEAAKERAYNKAAAVKKAHDDLRTSPIALKALEIYNRGLIGVAPYASWADVNCGAGAQDHVVRKFIEYAEAAESKEKEAAEKLAARRLDIYKELGGVFFSNFEPQSPIGYAIDRIIALEDKAA